MYDIEQITKVNSVPEAIAALQADPEAVIICGGSDVLVRIREGKLAGCRLVSIHAMPELEGVHIEDDGTIVIGPATTFTALNEHPLIQEHMPTLGYAVDQAGGPQLRNIATIGGNICNGATSADSASTLLTLNAQLELTSAQGKRYVPMEDFYAGPGRVKLEKGEILTAVRIAKKDYENFGGCYIKYAMRNAMDIATLGCAVHVKLDDSKQNIQELRLAFGVAAPTPIRCRKAEETAAGKPLNNDTLGAIAATALTEVSPRTSWRASKEFREQLVKELSQRATIAAAQSVGGTVQ